MVSENLFRKGTGFARLHSPMSSQRIKERNEGRIGGGSS
jgi:hypothetical protein